MIHSNEIVSSLNLLLINSRKISSIDFMKFNFIRRKEMKHFAIIISTIFLLIVLGCSENSSNNSNDNTNNNNNNNQVYKLEADVKIGTFTLSFKTNNVIFRTSAITGGIQRTITGVMTNGNETYNLILSVFDLGTGAKTYKLTDPMTEAQASFFLVKG